MSPNCARASLPQLYLWQPDAYKDKLISLSLYKGIVIGVAGLLALFLTIVFVVKGAVIFPAAAALAWAVLAYVCIDFGFWDKIFDTSAQADRVWRAGAETSLAATLLVFLFAYLNLNRWHVRASHVAIGWLVFLVALIGLAVYDAPIAAGVARISLATVAAVGFILVLYLSTHGYDRAVMLIPTWFLLLVWVIAAGFTVTGSLTNDLVSPALIGGLVLIVMLIGFTVMQNAFAGGGLGNGAISDSERKALALTGCGDIIFDWDVDAGPRLCQPRGRNPARPLARRARRAGLEMARRIASVRARPLSRLPRYDARAEGAGASIRNSACAPRTGIISGILLKARPVVGPDGEVIRVIGTLADVTEQKTAQTRLLHDAVHDNLTGLPNRELFFDRLDAALKLSQTDAQIRPTVICIDIDRFKHINETIGFSAGDSILLTIARRLGRILKPQDTLARLSSDQFAAVVISESETDQIIALANVIRRAVSTPVTFGENEIPLTASIGLALFDPQLHANREDMLNDAEIAVRHGKRIGGNRIEVFRPSMRTVRSDRLTLEADLRRALDRGEMHILFPADRPAGGSHRRRFRGLAALGSSAPWAFEPGGIHPCRRGDRQHCRSRPLRDGANGARTFGLASGARCRSAALRQRQYLIAAIAASRSAAGRECGAVALEDRARHAEARIDRKPGHGKPGICGADSGAHS